uniref:Acyltransferase n=1 Tax=Panagrellus redivivus TaxID=6233 RepID=A0A7E4VZ49_PANRE
MKYRELQGLRGIAILAVVLYHLWPVLFLNGFMGVDMFFVLSGFLMIETTFNHESDGFKCANIVPFWYRRIRRIVPLAILNVFATWIIVLYKLSVTNLPDLKKDAICALSFSTNICNIYYSKNYFDMSSIDYFKHYWSLGVEIQFYLIVPGLFLILRHLSTKMTLFCVLPFLITASILFQTYLFANDHSQIAFFLLPSRLWQFCIGIGAFYVRRYKNEIVMDVNFVNSGFRRVLSSVQQWLITELIAILLVFSLFVPALCDVGWMMLVIVFLTACVIISLPMNTLDTGKSKSRTLTLSNPLLLVLGNASYAIYVFHWMIQHIVSVISLNFDLFESKLCCFYTVIAIGILVHFIIEKPLLSVTHTKSSFCIVVSTVYAALLLLIFITNDKNEIIPPSIEAFYNHQAPSILNTSTWASVASSLNSDSATKLALYTGRHHCHFYDKSDYVKSLNDAGLVGAELRGSGNLSILVTGNSHAECALPGIKAALGQNSYRELNMFGTTGLTPFPGFRHATRLQVLMDAVDHYAPDVIILMFKYQDDVLNVPLTYPLTDDPIVKGMQSTIDFLSNRTGKVFINGDHFQIADFNIWKFTQATSLHVRKDYSFYEKYRDQIFSDLHTRWQAVDCPKCVIINMWPAFCLNNRCSPLDSTQTVPLFWDDNHVNLFGSYLMAPLFKMYFQNDNSTSPHHDYANKQND